MSVAEERVETGARGRKGKLIFRNALRQGAEILVEMAENGAVVKLSLLLRFPPEEFLEGGMGAEGEERPCIQAAEDLPHGPVYLLDLRGASRPFAIRRVADDAAVFP